MIKAVIFDMDGVLIDSEPMHKEVDEDILADFGIKVSHEEFEKYAGASSRLFWGALKEKYNLPKSVEELASIKKEKFLEYIGQKDIKPIKGIPELLKNLKENSLKLAVASSSPIKLVEYITHTFGIDKEFDTLVSGEFVKQSKPEPDIFLYTADKLGVKPEECVIVEDSTNGVKAAKRAGMRCIGFRNINSGNQDLSLADKIIDNFCEIDAGNL